MPRTQTQKFYDAFRPIKELEPITTPEKEIKAGQCEFCGSGAFTNFKMVRLWDIKTRFEDSYISRSCKSCGCNLKPIK